MAQERGVLYGLVVYASRRVSYAAIDPALARELMIREGLVRRRVAGRTAVHPPQPRGDR